ncbi:Helicase protein MOM1 [Bienertia sinuspersici]
MSGESSGLRRSTRNSSPVHVRKSERLEKLTPPKASSSSTKKKTGNSIPSPLRRSGRDNKLNSPSSKGSPSAKGTKQHNKVSNTPNSSKEKREKQDKTLKEIAEEVRDQSKQNSDAEVGGKKKKRLDARHYREMFKPLKKAKVSESESDRKSEPTNGEDSEESGSEKVEEENQENSDEEELRRDSEKDIEDDDDGGLNSDNNDDVCRNKPCEYEGGEDMHVVMDHNVSSPSSPRNEAAENFDQTEEVPGSVAEIEKHVDRATPSALNKLSDDSHGSGCRQKGMTVGASAFGSEGMFTCPSNDVISVPFSGKISNLSEECVKCSLKRSLNNDSPGQELCGCLSSTVNGMDDSEDRGQVGTYITAEFADQNGENIKQSNSSLDVQWSICVTCKHAGKLLYCCGKMCSRSYHHSCSLNPEENIHLANWYCSDCTNKRFAFGVYSVSQGIESILGVREVELQNSGGRQKQKQCFVKYKGLAHVHNCWVSEQHLLHEAPELCVKLGMQKEDMQWNPDWAVPHRLLKRRSVVIDDHCNKRTDQGVSHVSSNQHEWLVKWCGLDYNHATWELEDSSFLKKPEAQRLFEEYEKRHNKAKGVPLSGSHETQEKRKGWHVKLGRHTFGGPDSSYLNSVNKLREFHHKGHNAVLLDEQERVVKVIHLVTSLVTNVCRPFLIITQHAYLSSWEDEFVRMGVSMNVVVYGGNADARNIIRSLEFYDEGGQVMLQVLLSSAETVSEDIEELKGIVWEAVIIDDCQQSCILANSGCFMNMTTRWRLLLINAQLKDDAAEYFKILSLLEPGGSFDHNAGSVYNSDEDIKVLKDRLSSFVICSSFLEYWVPVEISNLQLEQYCYSILSNSSVLRSVLKSDPMNTLRDILISLRKCCDHPYIADLVLQRSLVGGLSSDAMMDLGIKASGKLYLLEKLLSEFKNLELKVLILFQPTGGSGRDTTGYILEDFLLWRFGSDSYEHIATGLVSSKKQAACNQFNSLRERSFFLLEARACSASIKISSVDAVIIFDSDWNPQYDLRALQKITIDSKLEQIKVFRLYCPCTIEEKILIFAKNEVTRGTLENICPSNSHALLMWGSSYLFSRLDKFHCENVSDCKGNIVFESSFFTGVIQEIISLFQKCKTVNSSKYISMARQSVGCYLKCIPLIGEQKIQQEDGLPPLDFWTKLLEGKQPHWKYLSGSSQRNRKRVHYGEASPSEAQSDEAAKKRKKTDSTKVDYLTRQAELSLEKLNSGNNENQGKCGASLTNLESMANDPSSCDNVGPTLPVMTSSIPGAPAIVEFDNIKFLHDEQRGLIDLLKQNILRLCKALPLEDDGKRLAEQFLEFLIKNFRVPRRPETTLQALLLSVCWTAAEEQNMNIDHKTSLSIAREKLGFNCSECEAEDIHSMLKKKMEDYLRLGITNLRSKGNSVESPLGNLKNATVRLEESSLGADCLKKQGLSPVHIEKGMYIKKVERGCNKQLEMLREKHRKELEEFEKSWEERRMKLEKWCKVESAAIRVTHANSSVRIDKLRALDNDYAKKREELEREISICRKELEARQQIERDEGQTKIAGYMERAKSLEQRKLLEESHAMDGVKSQVAEPFRPGKDSNDNLCYDRNLKTQQSSEIEASRTFEAGRELIVSALPGNLENSDERRTSGNDSSINAQDNVSVSKTAVTNVLATEGPGCADLAKSKDNHCLLLKPAASSALDSCAKEGSSEQPCAPEQVEKDTDQVDDVAEDRSALVGNDISRGSTTGSLVSPVDSVTKKLTADMSQGLGNNSCNGLGEQVPHDTGVRNTLISSDAPSSNCPNRVSSDLPCNEGTSNSTEYSLNTHSGNSDQVRVAPDGRLDNLLSGSHMFNGGTTTPMHQDHDSAGVLGEAISQPFPQLAGVDSNNVQNGTYVSLAREAVPVHASHPNRAQVPVSNASRFPAAHNSDPLQIEIDGIHRDLNNFINFHEQKKLQLKSECEKEIKELIAEIKSKYDKKFDEAEKSFSLKKNELEMYLHKIVMNKTLAEAFRSKCTEYKAAPRMPQLGLASNSVESSSQSPFTRPLTSAGSFSTSLPAAPPPFRDVRPSTVLGQSVRIPHIPPTAAQQQQLRREVRAPQAPAPHIQAFRSASQAISSCSMPSGTVLVAQSPNNPASTSVPLSVPLPPPAPSQLNHHGQSHQEESLGEKLLSSNKSATELLLDIARRTEANPHQLSGNIPPLPDNVHHSEPRDLSQFDGATNLQSPSNKSAGDVG